MKKIYILIIALVLALCGCTSANNDAISEQTTSAVESTATPQESTPAPSVEPVDASKVSSPTPEAPKNLDSKQWEQFFHQIEIDSPSAKNNMLNDTRKTLVFVTLPPSYFDETEKRYPVVYYLHGFQDTPGGFSRQGRNNLRKSMMNEGAKEYLFVEVSGYNKYGGSFYVNSPVTGNWEDYFISEVIPKIDADYRTIADGASRGICGFSMGGFGCLNLAFKYTDVFSAAYSMSPGVLTPELDTGLKDAMRTWAGDSSFKSSYGQAFAYDLSLGDPYFKEPKFDGSDEDNKIINAWNSGFGDWDKKIDAYLALDRPLKAITIGYSPEDYYTWIPKGTVYLSERLTQKRIENTLYTYSGGHTQSSDFMSSACTEFFNKYLGY